MLYGERSGYTRLLRLIYNEVDPMTDIERYRKRRARRIYSRLDAWEEEKHPRDASGRFSSGGASGSSEQKEESNPKTTHEGKTESKYRNMRNSLAGKIGKEDGTFDLETGEPVSFDNGYQVSFQTSNSEEIGSDGFMGDKDYDSAVDDLSKRLGSKPYLGKFGEPEISFHCNDYDTCMKMATKYNQHSIFDWSKGDIVENPFYDESTNKIRR
jgi:hypothetical protein